MLGDFFQPKQWTFSGSPEAIGAASNAHAAHMQAAGQIGAAQAAAAGQAAQAQAMQNATLYQQPAAFANAFGNAYNAYASGLGQAAQAQASGMGSIANALANERGNYYGANAMAEAARMGALGNIGSAGIGAYGSASNAAMDAWARNQTAYNQSLAAMQAANQSGLAGYGAANAAAQGNVAAAQAGAMAQLGRSQMAARVLGGLGLGGGGGGSFSAGGPGGPIASGAFSGLGGGGYGGGSSGGGDSDAMSAIRGLGVSDPGVLSSLQANARAGMKQLDDQHYSSRGMPSQMLDKSLAGLLQLTDRSQRPISDGMNQFYGFQQRAGDQAMDRFGALQGGVASGMQSAISGLGSGFGQVGNQIQGMWDNSLGRLPEFVNPIANWKEQVQLREMRDEYGKQRAYDSLRRQEDARQIMAARPISQREKNLIAASGPALRWGPGGASSNDISDANRRASMQLSRLRDNAERQWMLQHGMSSPWTT